MNGNEQSIFRGKLYEGGRYWLGAGFKFIDFPRMQMAYIWSSSYKSSKNFEDDKSLVTVRSNDITARSQDGLRITISLSIHYKVGTQFDNQTKLLEEFIDLYQRYGDPLVSWSPLINKITVASVSTAL